MISLALLENIHPHLDYSKMRLTMIQMNQMKAMYLLIRWKCHIYQIEIQVRIRILCPQAHQDN